MIEPLAWKKVHQDDVDHTHRLAIDGGYLYRNIVKAGDNFFVTTVFVPDNSMQVFAHHIREAFNQGYDKGKEEALKNANHITAPI